MFSHLWRKIKGRMIDRKDREYRRRRLLIISSFLQLCFEITYFGFVLVHRRMKTV